MNQNILVTGGTGYVGCVLTPKLLKLGYNVRVLDIMWFGEECTKQFEDHPDCELIQGDIRDETIVKRALAGIDTVIHLAAISNDPCSDLNPKLTQQVNYDAVKSLVRLSKNSGVRRFIGASSSSVYGIKSEPDVTEDLPLEPITLYAKLKAATEPIILTEKSADFVPVCIRSATVCGYSPRMRLDLTVNILTSHAVNKGLITVFGGQQKRPNIHIDDITDLYALLVEAPAEKIAGEVFNAGGDNYRVIEIAEMAREVVGGDVKIEIADVIDERSYHISSEKIKNVLGFIPKRTVRDAIADVKKAFENGLIPDYQNTRYYNIKRMRELYH
ncbi:TPA: SDR family oxidoreductase [Candidatus Poribacteria bacterium]|nr:SDR family oxidoreductase [Candidatus Poribacteria bacterium]